MENTPNLSEIEYLWQPPSAKKLAGGKRKVGRRLAGWSDEAEESLAQPLPGLHEPPQKELGTSRGISGGKAKKT